MEFVNFEIEEKIFKINNINVNKYHYYTKKIKNDDKYLLISIKDTNIDFIKIIVNNEIKYINGDISRNIVEIKPNEEYYYKIVNKKDEEYINKLDFLESYLLISFWKTNLPFHINSNMKILFFNNINFELYDDYFTFDISTDNFIVKQKLYIQNYKFDNSHFKKIILDLWENNELNNSLEYVNSITYNNSILPKIFNIDFISLYKQTKIILNYKKNNIHNFEYINNNMFENNYKFYLTNCSNNIYIKVPYIVKYELYNFLKSKNNNNIGKSKYELFKDEIIKEYAVQKTNYIIIDVNNDSDDNYTDDEKSEIPESEIPNKKYSIINLQKNNKKNKECINKIYKNINEIKDEINKINEKHNKYKQHITKLNKTLNHNFDLLLINQIIINNNIHKCYIFNILNKTFLIILMFIFISFNLFLI